MESTSATVAMFAALAFVALLLILHVVRADLEPGWHMISEYAVGRSGWIMAWAFFALAASFIALALAFLPSARGVLGTLALVMLLVAGVGAAVGGLFPMDPVGTPPERFSFSGKMHGVGFMLACPERCWRSPCSASTSGAMQTGSRPARCWRRRPARSGSP